jgi:predicted amidohydrolase YtcJ
MRLEVVMRLNSILRAAAGVALMLICGVESFGQLNMAAPADLVVFHGKIYTLDAKKPWAEALAIRQGKIVAVGTDELIAALRGADTKVIDAGGQLVMPGFVDCHIHFLEGSLGIDRLHLEGAQNVADIQKMLREYAAKDPGNSWILGTGWNYAMFSPETLPNKKYLDELFPDRPVFISGYDGHTTWANSKALTIAGIGRETLDPPGGAIVRDPKTGETTGALKESASGIVYKVVPQSTRAEKLAALREGIRWANENGLTRVHSAGGDFEELDLFDELRRKGDLSLRFYIAYFLDPPELRKKDLDAIEAARKKYHDDWIDTDVVKMMIDGVVESHTAAMLDPYSDDPSTKGKPFWEREKYKAAVAELDKRGFQLFTHAIGEAGVRMSLDAYENAVSVNHVMDRRPRIEHIETVSIADIPRFAKIGVIASMQPLHAYPDADTLDVWARNAGRDRASRAWSWKSIADTGGKLAFGSDWPVVTLNPWEGLQTAVTRQTRDGKPDGGFLPGQRLTVAQAVDGYTLGAAFAGRREKTEGSLEVGKLADLIVVSQNIFEIDPHKIADTKVVDTIVGGRVVYQAEPN